MYSHQGHKRKCEGGWKAQRLVWHHPYVAVAGYLRNPIDYPYQTRNFITNIVATAGTALTDERRLSRVIWWRLLKRHARAILQQYT